MSKQNYGRFVLTKQVEIEKEDQEFSNQLSKWLIE